MSSTNQVLDAQYACANGCGALISKGFICDDCNARKRKAEAEQKVLERARSLPAKDVIASAMKAWHGQLQSILEDGTLVLPRRHWKRLEQLHKDIGNILGDD